MTRLKWRKIRFLIKELQEAIATAEKDGHSEEAMALLEKVLYLKKSEMDLVRNLTKCRCIDCDSPLMRALEYRLPRI